MLNFIFTQGTVFNKNDALFTEDFHSLLSALWRCTFSQDARNEEERRWIQQLGLDFPSWQEEGTVPAPGWQLPVDIGCHQGSLWHRCSLGSTDLKLFSWTAQGLSFTPSGSPRRLQRDRADHASRQRMRPTAWTRDVPGGDHQVVEWQSSPTGEQEPRRGGQQ